MMDDIHAAKKDQADRDFYLGLAEEHGGPVLELGRGTGRITLPIAAGSEEWMAFFDDPDGNTLALASRRG